MEIDFQTRIFLSLLDECYFHPSRRKCFPCDEKGLPKTRSVLARTKKECLEKLEKLKTEEFVFPGRLPNS